MQKCRGSIRHFYLVPNNALKSDLLIYAVFDPGNVCAAHRKGKCTQIGRQEGRATLMDPSNTKHIALWLGDLHLRIKTECRAGVTEAKQRELVAYNGSL